MDFGQAIETLKKGGKVARSGWNGKGMFLYLVYGQHVPMCNLRNEAGKHLKAKHNDHSEIDINPHIDMKAADGSIVVGWLASQTDMLACDWEVVE